MSFVRSTPSRVAEIAPTHTPALFQSAVIRAVELLKQGRLVALPSETVYGLAANAWNPDSVEAIFQVKGRPAKNPLIVHVSGLEMARNCVTHWTERAELLGRAFWPGPLTLVLGKAPTIPDCVTAGGPTVGIRWPGHPFFDAVIRAGGFPIAAPSANLSNQTSPTSAEHVFAALGHRIPLIVDGGACNVGIESTVVDISESVVRILRPGMVHKTALEQVLGAHVENLSGPRHEYLESAAGSDPKFSLAPVTGVLDVLRSPGLTGRHYAPKAKLWVGHWKTPGDLIVICQGHGMNVQKVAVIAHAMIPDGFAHVSVVPHDPEAFARALYAEWHRCDALNFENIIVEQVPFSDAWSGIRDRLFRASAGAVGNH